MSFRCDGCGVIAVDISPMSEFFTLFGAMFPGGNVANSAVCCGLAPDGTGPGVGIFYTCGRPAFTTSTSVYERIQWLNKPNGVSHVSEKFTDDTDTGSAVVRHAMASLLC